MSSAGIGSLTYAVDRRQMSLLSHKMTFAGNEDYEFETSNDEGWLKVEIGSVSFKIEGQFNYRAVQHMGCVYRFSCS